MRLGTLLLLTFYGFTAGAQQAAVMDVLNATAWVQTSVEYRASALQAYRSAGQSLPKALKDRNWTAALEQTGKFRKLPPAIIVDVDETVLDNTPGQARFLLEGNGRYDRNIWMSWTEEKRAKAVPGAVKFLSDAAARGVTVFYVTNRVPQEAAATEANLKAEGFPWKGAAAGGLGDVLLLAGEKPEWTSDKSARRAAVAAHYRVIFLCGDDLNDFFSACLKPAERTAKAAEHETWWGERWIILPNPMYGSWEDALFDYDRKLSGAVVQEKKLKALRRE
ncbi:MAG: acid phosphatase [Acidobacteria bacterium]|nr:acid phosphatase [Acidobacteriota bacterium]